VSQRKSKNGLSRAWHRSHQKDKGNSRAVDWMSIALKNVDALGADQEITAEDLQATQRHEDREFSGRTQC